MTSFGLWREKLDAGYCNQGSEPCRLEICREYDQSHNTLGFTLSNLGENKEEEKRYLAARCCFSDYPIGTSITGGVENSIMSYPCLLQLVLHIRTYLPIANYTMRDVGDERSLSPVTDKLF